MADPAEMPDEELERAQYLGAAAYLTAYLRRMMRAIGVDDSDAAGVNAMVMSMVEPLNHATEAIWRALMKDIIGKEKAVTKFKESLNRL